MSAPTVSSAPTPSAARAATRSLRVLFVGERRWLDDCAPPAEAAGIAPTRLELPARGDLAAASTAAQAHRADLTVVFDPARVPAKLLEQLRGPTLGVHVRGELDLELAGVAASLDRLVSFFPSLTGERVGSATFWRAIPPPISDSVFAPARRPQTAMHAMTLGSASEHRERLLLAAKHEHDLLEIVHGLSGEPLIELLREYDIGVHVSSEPGGAFAVQIGMHLAAGQLLLCEAPTPAHGLERNIDYLHFDSPTALVWVLDRLRRFPEMYYRIRVRGRMKAEQYRASRLFARIAHDAIADLRAFGR